MAVWTNALRGSTAVLVVAGVLSACAAAPVAQEDQAGAIRSTTAAANAPHPLTTVPGVRVGVQITGATVVTVPTTLPTLPKKQAKGTQLPAKPGPTPVPVTAVDGCNRSYGTADQCVPLLAPGHKAVTCSYLRSSGLLSKPLVVVKDPLGLMKKKNVRKGTTPDGKYATISTCTD